MSNLKFLALAALIPLLLIVGACSTSAEPEVVTETPQACLNALDISEEMLAGPVVEQTDEALILLELIPKAYEAGYYGDNVLAQDIISEVEAMTVRTERRTAEVERLGAEYRAAADECRNLTSGEPT